MSDMADDPMDNLASHLAAEAQKDGVKLHDKVKVFEALTAWEGVKRKHGEVAKGQQPGNNGPRRTFSQYRDGVRGDEQMEN